jgi:hypothetical protein
LNKRPRRAPVALTELARYLALRPVAYYGFEASIEHEPSAIGERMHRLGQNIPISLIVFAQNPSALRLDSLYRVRLPIFISRRLLQQRFGGAAGPATAA